jgi:hypothetical protein
MATFRDGAGCSPDRLRRVPISVASERLGHSDQNIMLSIYSHAMPADSSAAANVWNDVMKDVIADSRKPAPERVLAVVSRRAG